MEVILLAARVLLAAVFLVAGLAKLADRAGSRQTLLDFGVPEVLAHPGGMLLPLAELLVAVLLLPAATAWWGALGALLLLLAFIAGISYNLARGRTPDCHCFGQLHSAPVGWSTLARNAVLAAFAGLVLWQGPTTPSTSVIDAFRSLTVGQALGLAGGLLLLALLLGEGWLLLNLLRQNGRLLLRIEALEERLGAAPVGNSAPQPAAGLPVGTPAPGFELASLADRPLTLDALRTPGKPVMLVFSDPGCGPCTTLLPDLADWHQQHAAKLTIALISRGSPEWDPLESTCRHASLSIL